MRNSLTLICVLYCWFGIAGKTVSAQPAAPERICSPAMLDVSALPAPPSFTYGGHLFVLEVQNISQAACSIQPPQVALAPASDTNNQPFYAAWRSGDPGQDTHEFQPQVLEPGAWVHMLFAWTSRAAPELNCDLYSEVRLGFSYGWQERNEPWIEIRHLWIRACGPFGVTGYRPGKYSSASPVPQKWLDWYAPLGLHEFDFPAPAASTEIATTSPLLSLSAQAKRTMLGERLFSLKLNFPRLAVQGCAFSQLRKRESDGSTVILMQQCDDSAPRKGPVPPAVLPWYAPGVMGLYMAKGNLDFSPNHFGPLEYDVTAPIGRNKGKKAAVQYARTRVDLIARDPALPKQAIVLDPLPACTASQLRVASLPPVISTPLKTLRAYDATNISPQACSLAGVPRTRGLDDKGNYQPFLPPACPNCENELFAPRPNGRIDLKQGETAHLLAGGGGNERGAGRCTTTPKFEFSLNRDAGLAASGNTGPLPADEAQSLTLPFEGEDCVSIDISAWRQGPYDGDPLNLHQAKLAQASEPAPIPSECNKPELLAHGRPHPIEGTHDPEYDLSMEQQEFVRDEPIPLYLWTNNSTDHPIELGSCAEPAYFKAGGFVLYDAYGHRVLNKSQIASDKQCKADPSGIYNPLVCTVNAGPFQLPAHTCTNSRIDLAKDYELPPGEYTLSTRDPGDTAFCPRRGDKPYKPDPATDIGFKVLQP
jgi:hypothetical protein